MLLVATGLALFARVPVHGSYAFDVLPGMVLLGLGMGVSLNPVLLAAMSEVPSSETGLASGVANTFLLAAGFAATAAAVGAVALQRPRDAQPGIETPDTLSMPATVD